MTAKRKNIPNPLSLSAEEKEFIKAPSSTLQEYNKKTFKGRMISMSDDFFEELNSFLKKNPTEGNRSSFIVRIVAEYIKNKKNSYE